MDEFDTRILTLIQQNNHLSSQLLAEEVGLSAAACQKRLQKLRRDGFVEADIAVLSPQKVGRGFMAVVHVRVTHDNTEDVDMFKGQMLDAPQVMQCYYVTGRDNFVLIVTMRDMAEYEDFTRRYFINQHQVDHFVTNMVVDRVKFTLSMPVELDQAPEEA